MSGAPGRVYTLAEATAMIGPLDALIQELRAAREVIADRELSGRLAASSPANGGGTEGRRFADAALRFSRGLAQLDHWGVVVRDLGSGICDFPARRDDRDVYLCWRVGEEGIAWWHELDGGFEGRRPLDDRTA